MILQHSPVDDDIPALQCKSAISFEGGWGAQPFLNRGWGDNPKRECKNPAVVEQPRMQHSLGL